MKSEITESSLSQSGEESSGYASLFRNKQFMCLWIAQVFSQFADRAVFVLFVAVLTAHQSTIVAGHTMGGAEMTSWLYNAFTIPAVALSPLAGVYVDRWSNRTVLIASNLARAFFVALVTVPLVKASPKLALALAFFISIGSQFFGPAETASIPRLVKKNDLYCANSLFFTTMMIALGFGFAIGEPILTHTGIGGAPWAIAGGFFFAAVLSTQITDNRPVVSVRDPWWEELRQGIAFIVDNPMVFRAILKITVLFSTIISLNVIAVGLAEQVMHLQPFQFGYIIAAAGLGMALGNFYVGHQGHNLPSRLLVYGGFTGLGFFMSLLASLGFVQDYFLPDIYFRGWLMTIPLLFSMLIGTSCAFVAVPVQAALQAAVPEDMRGKVFGAQNTAMSAASMIPVTLIGVSADNLPGGISTTLLIIGLPTLSIGIYQLMRAWQNPESRHKL